MEAVPVIIPIITSSTNQAAVLWHTQMLCSIPNEKSSAERFTEGASPTSLRRPVSESRLVKKILILAFECSGHFGLVP